MFPHIHKFGWAAIAGAALLSIAGPLLDIAHFGEKVCVVWADAR